MSYGVLMGLSVMRVLKEKELGRLLSVWSVFWVSLKAKHRLDLKRIVDKVSGCCWGLSFREFC